MDTDPTVEMQLLAQAEKQTAALESLRGMAMALMALLVIGALTGIFLTFAR